MFVTEAQTLDEALAIIKSHQTVKRGNTSVRTIKQIAALANAQASRKNVTLSDRVYAGSGHPGKGRGLKPSIYWDKAEVIRRHSTGDFTLGDLAAKANKTRLQIIFWLFGKDQPPVTWHCSNCKAANTSMRMIQQGINPVCRKCNKEWNEGLEA